MSAKQVSLQYDQNRLAKWLRFQCQGGTKSKVYIVDHPFWQKVANNISSGWFVSQQNWQLGFNDYSHSCFDVCRFSKIVMTRPWHCNNTSIVQILYHLYSVILHMSCVQIYSKVLKKKCIHFVRDKNCHVKMKFAIRRQKINNSNNNNISSINKGFKKLTFSGEHLIILFVHVVVVVATVADVVVAIAVVVATKGNIQSNLPIEKTFETGA